jgi:hypothetical protein
MASIAEKVRFAVCLRAKPDEDLQAGKVYRILPDTKAAEVGCLRVIDESGEDYLYSASRFVIVRVPAKARGRLLRAVKMEGTAR